MRVSPRLGSGKPLAGNPAPGRTTQAIYSLTLAFHGVRPERGGRAVEHVTQSTVHGRGTQSGTARSRERRLPGEAARHSPAARVRRPRLDYESHATGLDRNELGALLVPAGLGPTAEQALISLLALNGLRVSEATGASIEVLGIERGHRTLVVARKGGKVGTIPTLEPILGVPGAGLRPGAGVLCRRDLGSGRRWRSGLVPCGILADLGLPSGALAGPVQFRARGIRPPSAPGPSPARHSGRRARLRPPGGPRR